MPRYLFISAPADPTKKATVTGVRSAVGEAALVSAVDLPAFKVSAAAMQVSSFIFLPCLFVPYYDDDANLVFSVCFIVVFFYCCRVLLLSCFIAVASSLQVL